MKSQGHSTGSLVGNVTFVLNLVTPVLSLGKWHIHTKQNSVENREVAKMGAPILPKMGGAFLPRRVPK